MRETLVLVCCRFSLRNVLYGTDGDEDDHHDGDGGESGSDYLHPHALWPHEPLALHYGRSSLHSCDFAEPEDNFSSNSHTQKRKVCPRPPDQPVRVAAATRGQNAYSLARASPVTWRRYIMEYDKT